MQINIAIRYHLTGTRIDTVKRIGNIKCWPKCRAAETLVSLTRLWHDTTTFENALAMSLYI